MTLLVRQQQETQDSSLLTNWPLKKTVHTRHLTAALLILHNLLGQVTPFPNKNPCSSQACGKQRSALLLWFFVHKFRTKIEFSTLVAFLAIFFYKTHCLLNIISQSTCVHFQTKQCCQLCFASPIWSNQNPKWWLKSKLTMDLWHDSCFRFNWTTWFSECSAHWLQLKTCRPQGKA